MAPQDQAFSWTVHTHEHKDRSIDWYWTLGLVAVAGAVVSIFLGNYLLVVIIGIGAISLGVLAARGPRLHSVKIDKRGVVLDGTLYPYSSIDSFWVEEKAENPRLLVSTSGILHPQFIIPIEESSRAHEIREFMRRYAKEEEQDPHFGEHLAEMFGL
jgi:hypothetical protein